jgi:hypothetical protein
MQRRRTWSVYSRKTGNKLWWLVHKGTVSPIRCAARPARREGSKIDRQAERAKGVRWSAVAVPVAAGQRAVIDRPASASYPKQPLQGRKSPSAFTPKLLAERGKVSCSKNNEAPRRLCVRSGMNTDRLVRIFIS